MSSKKLFASPQSVRSSVVVKPTNTTNLAGGTAYALSSKAALAQLAVTGCFNDTFYSSAKDQLDDVLALASKVDPIFLAKVAVYARESGLMKDAPALLLAVLASRDTELLSKAFPRVINNPKMLRNFVQIIRSGKAGRKSFGTRPKKLIQAYFDGLTDAQVFRANVGNDPTLQDIIKLTRPKPITKSRSALYAYLLGKDYNKGELPMLAQAFEAFKADPTGELPDVPFLMLTALSLTNNQWKDLARNSSWTQTRMNLNTFLRHNVFSDKSMVDFVAAKLQDEDLIKKANVFPYELFSAFKHVDEKMPTKITIALQKAAEIAIQNIPELDGQIYVFPDVSGSMESPITGDRGSVTTKMNCIDIAALVSASILRKNPDAVVMPFDNRIHSTSSINPMDSIMTNAAKLAKFGGGGTDCHLPLALLNKQNAKGDLVIYVSDNESWIDTNPYADGTQTMQEWKTFKARNPKAKLVCIDVTPNKTTQVHPGCDILNIGGFSDNVFQVIAKFVENGNDKDLWVKTIEQVEL